MTFPQAQFLFKTLVRKLAPWPCALTLELGPPAEFPKPRNMAYAVDGTKDRVPFVRVVIAPKLLQEPTEVIVGVLMHELGHALAFTAGDDTHAERVADELAELYFGVTISYDKKDVQTIGRGTRPRPSRLPP